MGMVELESVNSDTDVDELRTLIENHARFTGSTVAEQVLNNWQASLEKFVKVMPTDYKRVLQERQAKLGQVA
jgi:glutamate synthase domain-containing protein 3